MPGRLSGLWVPPDSFDPATFTLSDQPVQAVETSSTDPKVRLDTTGLFGTDSSGIKQIQVKGDGTGFVLNEGSTTDNPNIAPLIRALEWLRVEGDGNIASRIYAKRNSGVNYQPHLLIAEVIGNHLVGIASQGAAQATLRAYDDGGGPVSQLNVAHNMATNGLDYIEAVAGAVTGRIIGSDGQSDFLQTATRGALKAAWGSGQFVFTAATEPPTVTVNHGLANAPVVVLTGSASRFSGVEVRTITATQITFGSRQYDGTATTATRAFYWLAIG